MLNTQKYFLVVSVRDGNPQIGANSKLLNEDRIAHDWYRFVLSFPPQLVRHYSKRFGLSSGAIVLDPFCGTGTTLVECKKLGFESIGIERNPIAWFASRVKLDWQVNPDDLIRHATRVAKNAAQQLRKQGFAADSSSSAGSRLSASTLKTLRPAAASLLLADSISPVPLHKTLVLLQNLDRARDPRLDGHEILALAKTLVSDVGNLRFGPEVGIGRRRRDADVVGCWLKRIRTIAGDLQQLRQLANVRSRVYLSDARRVSGTIAEHSVDAVITSPPYPNEKDYTRTTRLESVILGFLRNKQDLRSLKQRLVRSNTRNVYKTDQDDLLVTENDEIQKIAEAIEARRIELGKTSGFERLYAKVTKLYFGGMSQHLSQLRGVLRPGAKLAFIVGDQASYLRIMIRTGRLLADIAESLGYDVLGIDLFRTRLATATKEQLREEVVL